MHLFPVDSARAVIHEGAPHVMGVVAAEVVDPRASIWMYIFGKVCFDLVCRRLDFKAIVDMELGGKLTFLLA